MSDRERILQDLAEELQYILSNRDVVEERVDIIYLWLQENWPS